MDGFITGKRLLYRVIFVIPLLMAALIGIPANNAQAQSPRIDLGLEIDEPLLDATHTDISTLITDLQGKGKPILQLAVGNRTLSKAEQLFFTIELEITGVGRVLEIHQDEETPFSLNPGQYIISDIQRIREGMPGITEYMKFNEPAYTPEGRAFTSRPDVDSELPHRGYRITFQLYQGANKPAGGSLIAETSAAYGPPGTEDYRDTVHALSPGGRLGSDVRITTGQPVFNWEGDPDAEYRLIVVRNTGEDARTLIQNALLTDSLSSTSSRADYKKLEASVTGATSLIYPEEAPNLYGERSYLWQVFREPATEDSADRRISSEIRSFGVEERRDELTPEMRREMRELLTQLLTDVQAEQMELEDYRVDAIELENETYEGAEVLYKLEELLHRLHEGEVQISP